jgi:hypothetical protein
MQIFHYRPHNPEHENENNIGCVTCGFLNLIGTGLGGFFWNPSYGCP